MWVVSLERLAILIDNYDRTWSLGIVESVFCETHATAWESIDMTFWQVWSFKMDIVLITLELTSPESSEIYINLAVSIVAESAHVDAVAARHWCWLRDERTCRVVGNGCTPMEHVVAVLEREVHDILLHLLAEAQACCLFLGIGWNFNHIFLHVAIPELTTCPRDILLTEHAAMVGDSTGHWVTIDRKDMIVLHDVLVTIVVLNIRSLPVVTWIDIDLAIEYMNRWICHIVGREKITLCCLCSHSIVYYLLIMSLRKGFIS